jgi:hypothetical protein
VIVLDWFFTTTPWDGNNPTYHVETDLYPDLNSNGIGTANDWQRDGNVISGDYVFGGNRPLMWTVDDHVRVWVDDGSGGDPGSTVGATTLLVALLPRQ